MKYLLILFALLLVAGCEPGYDVIPQNITQYEHIHANHNCYMIITIDGCEYISFTNTRGHTGGTAIIHKANCNNPEHRKH